MLKILWKVRDRAFVTQCVSVCVPGGHSEWQVIISTRPESVWSPADDSIFYESVNKLVNESVGYYVWFTDR